MFFDQFLGCCASKAAPRLGDDKFVRAGQNGVQVSRTYGRPRPDRVSVRSTVSPEITTAQALFTEDSITLHCSRKVASVSPGLRRALRRAGTRRRRGRRARRLGRGLRLGAEHVGARVPQHQPLPRPVVRVGREVEHPLGQRRRGVRMAGALGRPVFTLKTGMSTLLEKQVRHLRPTRLTLWVRPEMEAYCRGRILPELTVPAAINAPTLSSIDSTISRISGVSGPVPWPT